MQIQPSFLSSNNTLAGPVICQVVIMSVISDCSRFRLSIALSVARFSAALHQSVEQHNKTHL